MSQILSDTTKAKINKVINDLIEKELEDQTYLAGFKIFDELPPHIFNNVIGLACDRFRDEFEKLEFDYELLSEFYNEKNEIQNLELLQHLSCEYAESLF